MSDGYPSDRQMIPEKIGGVEEIVTYDNIPPVPTVTPVAAGVGVMSSNSLAGGAALAGAGVAAGLAGTSVLSKKSSKIKKVPGTTTSIVNNI